MRAISTLPSALKPRVPSGIRQLSGMPKVTAALAENTLSYDEDRYGIMDSQEVMDIKKQAMVYDLERHHRRAAEEVRPE